jgi:tellurite resistance protein TerC
MLSQTIAWIAFNIFVLFMLMLDLGVFHKKDHAISIKESIVWSIIWIIVAMLFNLGVYFFAGSQKAMEFLACYIVERSLSVDNIFVFILIFSYFRIEAKYQYKILFWGILGALIMRAAFILAGVSLIHKFHWLIYLFGAFLVYVGFKLAFESDVEVHPEKNPVLNLFKKFFPLSHEHDGGKFFIQREGRRLATPLLLVLIVVETTDIVFAVDSIPAALAITLNSFTIYSANVFAILGLRAMYFALAGCMDMFKYLNYGLAVVLSFVGAKMLLTDIYPISINISLVIIAVILSIAIVASIISARREKMQKHH